MTPALTVANPFTTLMKRADLIFTGGLFLTVLLLIMPIPAVLLDTVPGTEHRPVAAGSAGDRVRQGSA